jgi:hypothetical protein
MRNLLLPTQTILAINLSSRTKFSSFLQENRPQDDFIFHDGLVVIRMCGTVGAVVAVDVFARVTSVGISLEAVAALCEFDGGFRDDLVEGERAAGEGFACITVAARLSSVAV